MQIIFLSLTSPDVLKAKVTGLLVCVVFMWLRAASQSLPLLFNFDSSKVSKSVAPQQVELFKPFVCTCLDRRVHVVRDAGWMS